MASTLSVCLALSLVLLGTAAMCPPLQSDTVDFSCLIHGDDVGNCSETSVPGTKARFECKPGFKLIDTPTYWFVMCQGHGTWDKTPFECHEACGMRNEVEAPPGSHQQDRPKEFPWHVAIYEQLGEANVQICGGSLISPSIVVSAAHCFYNDKLRAKRDPTLFTVVAGKFFQSWDAVEERSQRRQVKAISVPLRFRGRERNYRDDMAVVRLASPVYLTNDVALVCVAWDNEGLRDDFKVGRNGTVPGWRFDETIPHIQSVDLPYVPFQTCDHALSEEARPLNTPDKFCAGYVGRNISVCPGDSGSGIVFREPGTGRYFLRGLVSISFKPSSWPGDVCYRSSYTAFTSFSEHRAWVRGLV